METVTLVFVSELMNDKNGTPMMYGRTAEYIDKGSVFHKGDIVACYNVDLFKKFVIGLKVAL